jgi:hypothetical protein
MDSLRKVTGVWRGIHRYDFLQPMLKPGAVSFTLVLRQNRFGRFTGTITEDPENGMPGTGVVEGHFTFPHIEFTKQMPVCHVVTHTGKRMTLRDYLIQKGYSYEHGVLRRPIHYQGTFSAPKQAQGIWIIRAGQISLLHGKAVQLPESRGNWSIEKEVA